MQRTPHIGNFALFTVSHTLDLTFSHYDSLGTAFSSPSPDTTSPLAPPLFRRQELREIPKYTCTVVSECQACSALEIQTKVDCKETHNHQKINCKFEDPKNEEDEELKILLPKYHSCARVKAVEARRYAHFLSTNVFLAFFSGVLMVWRKRKLAAAQYRRMARRIGIA
ncbi:hypothetical protein BGZ74_003603 [Mortierella antarctica]|nr:hypothetical protein BGZ74_003603 [Mortierella antarctica]